MKLGKYYPYKSEIESAIAYLGKYELDRKKYYINRDYLRGYRCVAHREYDSRWKSGDLKPDRISNNLLSFFKLYMD